MIKSIKLDKRSNFFIVIGNNLIKIYKQNELNLCKKEVIKYILKI